MKAEALGTTYKHWYFLVLGIVRYKGRAKETKSNKTQQQKKEEKKAEPEYMHHSVCIARQRLIA